MDGSNPKPLVAIKPELLEATLHSPEPTWELHGVLCALLAEGYDREQLVADLMQFRESLDDTEREKDIDTIHDGLSALTGYCSPHFKL
jgi:hypothetical protein